MKKSVKIFTLLLAALLCLSFTACAKNSTDGGSGGSAAYQAGDKIENFFMNSLNMDGDYYFHTVSTSADSVMDVEQYKIGDKLVLVYNNAENNLRMIIDSEYCYIIDDKNQTVIKVALSSDAEEGIDIEAYDEAVKNDESVFTSGTEEYNGTEYDYETCTYDGHETKYYFDKTDGSLKYMVDESIVVEWLDYSNEPDASMAEIPESYTVISY